MPWTDADAGWVAVVRLGGSYATAGAARAEPATRPVDAGVAAAARRGLGAACLQSAAMLMILLGCSSPTSEDAALGNALADAETPRDVWAA